MLFADLVIRTNDRALQEAPDILNGIGMNVLAKHSGKFTASEGSFRYKLMEFNKLREQ